MDKTLENKRVLITGVNGQVGKALSKQLFGQCELITSTRTGEGADIALDLSNHAKLEKNILEIKPDFIINPAAYTNVDGAEDEKALATSANAVAPGVMAEACKHIAATLIHYSTDYVFNGKGTSPYKEIDPTDPVNIYGASKLAGEQAIQAVDGKHLIFRTCWVYDAEGKNFLNAILSKAREMETLKIVNDQFGTPTSADFISEITQRVLVQLLGQGQHEKGNERLFHIRPEHHCSWYDFAKWFISFAKNKEPLVVKNILAVSSSEFKTKAARPKWSVLDNSRLKNQFNIQIKGWQQYASSCMESKYS